MRRYLLTAVATLALLGFASASVATPDKALVASVCGGDPMSICSTLVASDLTGSHAAMARECMADVAKTVPKIGDRHDVYDRCMWRKVDAARAAMRPANPPLEDIVVAWKQECDLADKEECDFYRYVYSGATANLSAETVRDCATIAANWPDGSSRWSSFLRCTSSEKEKRRIGAAK